MEFHQVRYFLAVCDQLNFTRAAEACHVSQPALTMAIRKLEDSLGGPLFVREPGRVELTPLGKAMRGPLGRIEETRRAAAREAGEILERAARRIDLGVMCTVGPGALGPALAAFQRIAPGVEIVVHDVAVGEGAGLLLAGAIDCAILGVTAPLTDRLAVRRLFAEPMVLAAAADDPLARRPRLVVKDLSGARYADRLHCEFRDRLADRFAAEGVSPVVVRRSEREDWLLDTIGSGEAVSVYPLHSVVGSGLVARPIEDLAEARDIAVAFVSDRPLSAAAGRLVGFLEAYDWPGQARAPAAG